MEPTIFSQLFENPAQLIDRHILEPNLEPVDVIIPIINTNPLFRRNLFNFYQRVPIRKLIIGDGGSTDGSIDIVREFPRVEIIDQRQYKSLGKCIAELIDHVEAEWFIYFHADVFLPEGWYETMCENRKNYDWMESSQRNVVLADYWSYDHKNWRARRAFSGAQMGRRKALQSVTSRVDDDYLQRQEDAILASLVEDAGFKYGRVSDVYIHHEVMNKTGGMEPKLSRVDIHRAPDPEWDARMYDMQIKGFIKYCSPNNEDMRFNVIATLDSMASLNLLNERELVNWVNDNHPQWMPTIQQYMSVCKDYQRILRMRNFVRRAINFALRVKSFVTSPIRTRLLLSKR